jgi:hypothetical protein
MKNPQFTIVLKGSPEDGGKLRLEDFLVGVKVITDALKDAEKRLTGRDKSLIKYKIVHLSQHSPATITVEPIEEDVEVEEKGLDPKEVINTVLSELILIKGKKAVPQNLDYHSMQKYAEINSLRKRHITSLTIKNGHQKISIDEKFGKNIIAAIGEDEYEEGSLTGKLEVVNAHSGKNKFYIFPLLGASKVQCIFPPELKDTVKDALYERVEVEGLLRYKSWDKFPYAVDVKKIEKYPTDEMLSRFSDLVGIAPNATSGMNPTEFIRRLRDEEG